MSTTLLKRAESAGRLRSATRSLLSDRLQPTPDLTISEWADRYRVLSREASAEPGRWRTSRAPYQRGIMDAISDPMVERVVWMSSAQVGKTEGVNNVVGYYADQDPAPVLVLQPTIEMGQAWSKDRLAPMIRDTPRLRARFPDPRSRHSGNTLLHKVFPGGHITISGANSAASLASRPIRILLCDEIDRYPASAGTEGDPVQLAAKRTSTFWNRKIVLVSTPTVKGISRIERAFEDSDQRRYHVPCPNCDEPQTLKWSNLKWEDDDASTAAYACEHCGVLIEESEKPAMLAAGTWIAAKPGHRTAGFHLNALYSPWARWGELVTEFLEAKGSPEQLKVFVNTVLGETWEDEDAGFEPEGLMARAVPYPAGVPMQAAVLTAGVDVQGDRLELLIRGWGADEESWLIAHHRIHGDPEKDETWARLETLLTAPYEHEAGATLRIRAVMIDSGFASDTVYRFVRRRQARNVWASKGLDSRASELLKRAKSANRYGVKLWSIATVRFKDILFRRLARQRPGPGYMHFRHQDDNGPDAEFYAQFSAEVPSLEKSGRRYKRVYKQVRERNEAIDLEVYALAALHGLGDGVRLHLDLLAEQVKEAGEKHEETYAAGRKKRKVRSKGIS